MVFQFTESVASISADSINNLRQNFINIMRTGLDLEQVTADTNRDLALHVYDSMKLAGEKEKEMKEIEGTANITSGIIGLVACGAGFLNSIRTQNKISSNNRGLRRTQKLKNSNATSVGSGGSDRNASTNPFPQGKELDKQLTANQRSWIPFTRKTQKTNHEQFRNTKNNLGAAKYGPERTQIKERLDKREAKFTENKAAAERSDHNMPMMIQGFNTAISSITNGYASTKTAPLAYEKACYEAGVELARNLIETNRSIGQTEHDTAMKFSRLTDDLLNTEETLNRYHARA